LFAKTVYRIVGKGSKESVDMKNYIVMGLIALAGCQTVCEKPAMEVL